MMNTMMMGKILSLAIGFLMIAIMYSVYVESEHEDTPGSQLRRFTLLYCIITSFILGIIVNLNV
jgi:hypothetical protein